MTSAYIYRSELRFPVKIRELGETCSSEVILSGLAWKVKVAKNSVGEGANKRDILQVYLVCCETQSINEWSCEAMATSKLLSFNKSVAAIERNLPKTKFCIDRQSASISDYIPWNEINSNYVIPGVDEIFLDVSIVTYPMKHIIKTPRIDQSQVTFQFTIGNISKLNKFYSDRVLLRGIKWTIRAQKVVDSLALYLEEIFDTEYDINYWSNHVDATFSLLSSNEAVKPIQFSFSQTFYSSLEAYGFPEFIQWGRLMDPVSKFVEDDQAVFEINIKVGETKLLWDILSSTPRSMDCSICLESLINKVISSTKCGHIFHIECVKISIRGSRKCPLCNAAAIEADLRTIFLPV